MSKLRHLLLFFLLLLTVSNYFKPCVAFLVRPERQADAETGTEAPPDISSQETDPETEEDLSKFAEGERGSGLICCMPRRFESRYDSLLALSPLPRPLAPPMP